jgi:hypothetical protein
MVDKVALGQVFLPVRLFSPVSTIPPMHHTHLDLHAGLTRSLGHSRSSAFSEIGEHWIEKFFIKFELAAHCKKNWC